MMSLQNSDAINLNFDFIIRSQLVQSPLIGKSIEFSISKIHRVIYPSPCLLPSHPCHCILTHYMPSIFFSPQIYSNHNMQRGSKHTRKNPSFFTLRSTGLESSTPRKSDPPCKMESCKISEPINNQVFSSKCCFMTLQVVIFSVK